MTSQSSGIKNIVIVGQTVAACIAAAFLGSRLKRQGIKLSLIKHIKNDAPPFVMGRPSLPMWHQELKLDERDLMRFCEGSYCLGSHIKMEESIAFFSPFGNIGAPIGGTSFHHYWNEARRAGYGQPIEAFALSTEMVKTGHFFHPDLTEDGSLDDAEFGLALNRHAYCDYLCRLAAHLGVEILNAEVAETNYNDQTIASISLADGNEIQADYFIDGTDNGVLGTSARSDLSAQFPANCLKWCEIKEAPTMALNLLIDTNELQTSVALQHHNFETSLFRNDEATKNIPSSRKFQAGALQSPWVGNRLTLGLPSFDIGLSDGSETHHIITALKRFADLFPHSRQCNTEAAEYNRLSTQFNDRLKAYYSLLLNGEKPLTENISITDDLIRQVEQFKSRGCVVSFDEETFEEGEWISLMLALGHFPDRGALYMENIDDKALFAKLDATRAKITTKVSALPDYSTFINKYCPARPKETYNAK